MKLRFAGLLLLSLALLRPAMAQAPDPQAERILFDLSNQIRAEHHLAAFVWDPALSRAARIHAARMLRDGASLEHQYAGELDLIHRAAQAGAHFNTISENLARGRATPTAIEQLWMATPVHRANLLDAHLDAVGIGIVEQNGILYAVQDFSRTAPVLSESSIEIHVIDLLHKEGLRSAVPSLSARTACLQHASTAPAARLIVQWEGDVSHLPNELVAQLRQGTYQSAAVGACTVSSPSVGFTSGRVAVLFF